MRATPGQNRLHWLTRVGYTPLAIITAIFGPMLALRPGSTEDYWAWTIRPEMSAVWVGVAYTFGAMAITTMLVQGRWVSAIVPVVSTWPFSIVMLAATIIHDDRFFTGTIEYDVWLAIYVILPFALPVMFWLNKDQDPGLQPGEVLLPRLFQTGFIAAGVVAMLLGTLLVLAPSVLDQSWPWPLTPLMSQVIGGWMLFIAVGALGPLVEKRYVAYRYYLVVAAIWFSLLFAGSLVHLDDFRDGLATPLFLAAVLATVVLLLAIFAKMESIFRQPPVHHLSH